MSTVLVIIATVLSVSALLGSRMHKGASAIAGIAWWGGAFTVIVIWHWWATRAVG